jgi:hypothetical protein
VTIDDSASAAAQTVTITGSVLTIGASSTFGYGGATLQSLTINGGTGGDTFAISNAGTNPFPTSVVGGSGNDTFRLLGVSTLGTGGTLDGGGGVNTLDYTAYTAPASVDLVAGTATGTSGIANIQVVIPSDLTVAVSHGGTFRQGDSADTYAVAVANAGPGPTTGTVTVTVTLPTGLSPTAADSGTINGWSVFFSGQTITATRSDALAAGASYPALALTVSVAGNAPASVATTATVAGGGEVNTANDGASDPTSISPPLPPPPPPPPPPSAPPVVGAITAPPTGGSGGRVTLPGVGGAPGRTVVAFAGFAGEVRVASADLNGDGVPDVIVGAGPGAPGGHVKVLDGATGAELRSFLAFDGFSGGVFVGAGEVSGDGTPDIIVGAGAGAPGGHVKVFDGNTGELIRSFFAFAGYTGGVTVAGGDVNGDGTDDIIVGAAGGSAGGHVKAFDGATGAEVRSFFAFPGFGGGVFVGAVDLDGDGTDELLVGAGAGADPHVEAFGAGGQAVLSFLAYDAGFRGGVRVAGFTPPGGSPEIVTGSGIGAPGDVRSFDAGGNLIGALAATDADAVGGVFVS